MTFTDYILKNFSHGTEPFCETKSARTPGAWAPSGVGSVLLGPWACVPFLRAALVAMGQADTSPSLPSLDHREHQGGPA